MTLTPSSISLHTFFQRIVTSGVKLRLALKKIIIKIYVTKKRSTYFFQSTCKNDIAKIIMICKNNYSR